MSDLPRYYCILRLMFVQLLRKIEVNHSLVAAQMKHIVKILTLLVTLSALWVGLLQASVIPRSYTWLLPLYLIVSLGCYGLLMVGIGLMQFPTCPHEAILLQQDIIEAKDFLKENGVDIQIESTELDNSELDK